jgi:arginine-tRNA-protein transferase
LGAFDPDEQAHAIDRASVLSRAELLAAAGIDTDGNSTGRLSKDGLASAGLVRV